MAQICEILKYEGDNSTFIWKHPSEDFNSMTQLLVHELQEGEMKVTHVSESIMEIFEVTGFSDILNIE